MQEILSLLLEKVLSAAQIGVVLLVVMIVALYFMQEKMLYNPDFPSKELKFPENNPRLFQHPGERDMPYDNVYVTTRDDCRLHGWFIKQPFPREADTIIYFHENAGNIGGRLYCIHNMWTNWKVNVLIVGYRGYGHSTGRPNEQGIEWDAEAIFKFAQEHKEINSQRLFILGRSLGGAVAIQLVQKVQHQIAGLILENTFTSISDIVDHIFPFMSKFKGLILRLYWPSKDRISSLTVPIQFVSGLQDEIVPAIHVRQLHDLAGKAEFRHFFSVEQGMHNDTWFKGGEEYNITLVEYLRRCREAWTKRNTLSFGAKKEEREKELVEEEGVSKRKVTHEDKQLFD